MKAAHLLAALLAAPLLLIAVPAEAQKPGPSVAVVDIGEIFKSHPKFTAEMEKLRKEVQEVEAQFEAQGQALMQRKQTLEQTPTFNPGTQAYQSEEEAIAQGQAKLAADAQLARKKFIDREAQVYFDTYNHVQSLVASYAQQRGISLVMRFNRVDMKAEDRNTILQGVNRPVVYYDSNLDITDVIVTYLKQHYPQQQQQARQGAAGTANR